MIRKILVRNEILLIFNRYIEQKNPSKFSAVPKYIYYDAVKNHLKETKKMGLSNSESALYIIRQGLSDLPDDSMNDDIWSYSRLGAMY